MKRLTIHVGLHKTGTSAIQHALAQHREDLGKIGLCYPADGENKAHHRIAKMYIGAFKNDDAIALQNLTNICRKWLDTYSCEHFLISSEMFMEARGLLKELGFFRQFFQHVDAIVYLRRQDLLLESAYNQIVKQSGSTADILDSRAYFTNYESAITPLESGVGKENVRVRLYESESLLDHDVLKDLLATIGCGSAAADFKASAATNRSLGLASLEVMKTCGRFQPVARRNEFVARLIEVAPSIFPDRERPMVGHYLRPDERLKLLESCADSNARICKRFFPERDQLFFPPTINQDDGPVAISLEEVSRTLLEIWNKTHV